MQAGSSRSTPVGTPDDTTPALFAWLIGLNDAVTPRGKLPWVASYCCKASPICLRLLTQRVRRLVSRADWTNASQIINPTPATRGIASMSFSENPPGARFIATLPNSGHGCHGPTDQPRVACERSHQPLLFRIASLKSTRAFETGPLRNGIEHISDRPGPCRSWEQFEACCRLRYIVLASHGIASSTNSPGLTNNKSSPSSPVRTTGFFSRRDSSIISRSLGCLIETR